MPLLRRKKRSPLGGAHQWGPDYSGVRISHEALAVVGSVTHGGNEKAFRRETLWSAFTHNLGTFRGLWRKEGCLGRGKSSWGQQSRGPCGCHRLSSCRPAPRRPVDTCRRYNAAQGPSPRGFCLAPAQPHGQSVLNGTKGQRVSATTLYKTRQTTSYNTARCPTTLYGVVWGRWRRFRFLRLFCRRALKGASPCAASFGRLWCPWTVWTP